MGRLRADADLRGDMDGGVGAAADADLREDTDGGAALKRRSRTHMHRGNLPTLYTYT